MDRFVSAEAIHPGEFLQDELEARDWTQEDLADVLGISRRQVLNLIGGKSGLTPGVAKGIAEAFGQDAEVWMHLQVSYELARVAEQDRKVAKRAAVYAKVPVREVVRRGWIEEEKDPDRLCAAVCRFLHIERIDQQPEVCMAARKSGSYEAYNSAQVAWFFRARQLAQCSVVEPYRPSRLVRVVDALRLLCRSRADIRRVPAVLAEGGIRFVVLERLKGAKIDGATIWLDDQTPAVALSLRFDRIDNFWHTLMHELVHVKYHEGAIDIELAELPGDELPPEEQRANSEAAEWLVPKKKLDSFVLRTRPLYYRRRIVEFANSRGVHPGIVVGQLHKRGELGYNQMRSLLEPIRNELIGVALTDGWGDYPVIGGAQ